ncbi:uncharacterized protein PG998_015041 [Apiospora kogelbergensis]|uniref:uncharacterized protein n=1 Tax=Apiospora kogelbergensis TaxID=1337665 RepID=UPI0031309D11
MASYDDFNPRERELMIGAWHTVDSMKDVQIDGEKLARLCNFNTLKTASNNWGKVKGKIDDAIKKSEIAQLNEAESMVAAMAWQCTKDAVAPNYKRMVELDITKTVKTAGNRWCDLRNKFNKQAPGSDTGTAPVTPGSSPAKNKTPKSKKSTTGTKRKAATTEKDVSETPSKRAKSTPRKSKLAMQAAATSVDEGAEDVAKDVAENQELLAEAEA